MPEERTELSAKIIQEKGSYPDYPKYMYVKVQSEKLQEFESWISTHLHAIETAMGPVFSRLQEEENQYEGNMPGADYPYSGAFRLNYPLTKRKVRDIVNRLKQAYLDSDPIWAVTVPENFEVALRPLVDKLEKALDTVVDHHLEALDDFAQALFDSGLHGTGAVVPDWDYKRAYRRDIESYRGFDNTTQASLEDLLKFEEKYSDWKDSEDASRIHSKLLSGNDVEFEGDYRAEVRNTPTFRRIQTKDLRVYPKVEGYQGLRTTPIYGYIRHFTFFELKELEESEYLESGSLQKIISGRGTDPNDPNTQNEPVDVFIGTVRYPVQGKKVQSYKIWFSVKDRILLRTRGYTWWYGEPDLIPFYVRQEEGGFFKRGIGWDLRDEHVALVVMLNMYINAIDMANSLRLKVKKGSLAELHLLMRRWSPHLGTPWKDNPNEVDPMPMSTAHISAQVEGMEIIRRNADEGTGTTALQSGRESPTDPRAPAAKAAMLLQQVEPNMKEYVRSLEPAFRQVGRWLIWMYYQGIRLGWVRGMPGIEEMPVDLFTQIVNQLNPRAILFEYDRNGRTERNLTVIQLLAQYAPQGVPRALKIAISQMSSEWARVINEIPLEPVVGPAGPPGMAGPTPAGEFPPTVSMPSPVPSALGATNGAP